MIPQSLSHPERSVTPQSSLTLCISMAAQRCISLGGLVHQRWISFGPLVHQRCMSLGVLVRQRCVSAASPSVGWFVSVHVSWLFAASALHQPWCFGASAVRQQCIRKISCDPCLGVFVHQRCISFLFGASALRQPWRYGASAVHKPWRFGASYRCSLG